MKYIIDEFGTESLDYRLNHLISGICYYERKTGEATPDQYRLAYMLLMTKNNELDYSNELKEIYKMEIVEK